MPVGERIAYCALRFDAAVVLPKCAAAATASWPSWVCVAWSGAGAAPSYQTPANAPPVGYPTWAADAGQLVAPLETPSQYCVMTRDQPSLLLPRPRKNACSRGAVPAGSPLNVVSPAASVPACPHWEPQNTR